ncbi:MAG: hypothetical protein IJ523_12600 [Succinivibrionaceae bacterium]|nr:hypothetical protein [Succinivibrionaceae bacterium]
MEINFNIEKSQRKALAQKIAEIIGAEVEYLGVPSCAYQIDIFTLSKDAVLSFTDRSDTEIVEKVLDGLAEAGYTGETITPPEGTETATDTEEDYVEIDVTIVSDTEDSDDDEPADEPEETTALPEPLTAEISFPLSQHTVQSLTNLICMIHSRGALLSKATGGQFFADKSLADAILDDKTFRSIYELIAYIREWEETNPELKGIRFGDDKVIFDGFGAATDAEAVQTFTKLAAAMNKMALTQKRVQAKDVDDSNEKYALRIWLIRLGLNGTDFKADRKRLMAPLSGHTAFRNDAERERWEAKQKAKRDAAKSEQTEEEENDAVSE